MTKIINHELMEEAGGVLRDTFSLIFYLLKPDADLSKIDYEVGKFLASKKAMSGQKLMGFPFNVCTSINDEVIQGYPNRIVSESDLVSVDMSILCRGYFVDKAKTISMPSADSTMINLRESVDNVFIEVLPQIKVGMTIGKLGSLIEDSLCIFDNFVPCTYLHGHGIGIEMHEEPIIPNYKNGSEETLTEDQYITIEPIVYSHILHRLFFDDPWTIRSDKLCAHAEETIHITNDGVKVIT